MAQRNNCPPCVSATQFVVDTQGMTQSVRARCSNCKIQTPPVSPSLDYSATDKIAEAWNAGSAEEWPQWRSPLGAHDAYSKGAKAQHTGRKWIRNIDATVWAPGATGWTEYTGGSA